MGAVPEQTIVFETIGTVEDFFKAVIKVQGMEWLGEFDESDILPDDDFFVEEKKDKRLNGRLYLIMTNQQAMHDLLSLWNGYRNDPDYIFARGSAKWRTVFQQLKTVRLWDMEDRLFETGLFEDWQERVQHKQELIRFEAELWCRQSPTDRNNQQKAFEEILIAEGGRVITQAIIPDIHYHAVLAELPIGSVQAILNKSDIHLLRCEQVMFFRPIGQAITISPSDDPIPGDDKSFDAALPSGDPIVALLDGLPLANHKLLADRLQIDDPDDWSDDYPANDRQHGTAMASLIIHGELDRNEQPLQRPLYVRPILRPDPRDWHLPREESVPEDVLLVDLVHRSVRRLFEQDGDQPPVAPSIRIVNFSIGDRSRPFHHTMSPLARLLDWLSVKYGILFVVSAGNHPTDLCLDISRNSLASLSPEQLEIAAIKSIANDLRNRRLLSPAESMNSITVGAWHDDASTITVLGNRIDIFRSRYAAEPG